MPRPASYALRRLMLDAEYDVAEVERYAKRSICGQSEPLITAAVLVLIAIVGSIVLCAMTTEQSS